MITLTVGKSWVAGLWLLGLDLGSFLDTNLRMTLPSITSSTGVEQGNCGVREQVPAGS